MTVSLKMVALTTSRINLMIYFIDITDIDKNILLSRPKIQISVQTDRL